MGAQVQDDVDAASCCAKLRCYVFVVLMVLIALLNIAIVVWKHEKVESYISLNDRQDATTCIIILIVALGFALAVISMWISHSHLLKKEVGTCITWRHHSYYGLLCFLTLLAVGLFLDHSGYGYLRTISDVAGIDPGFKRNATYKLTNL